MKVGMYKVKVKGYGLFFMLMEVMLSDDVI